MGFLKINRTKLADENFLYLKFFVDLEGNPIYAKRIREKQKDEQQSFRKIDDYQTHQDLAVDIVKNNQELKTLWNELTEKFIDLIGEPYWFLVFYGYVCVDAIDNTQDFVRYDSVTTPKKQIQQMNADDPYDLHFDRVDEAEEDRWTNNKEDFQKLQQLHKIILERREKNKNVSTSKDDDEER